MDSYNMFNRPESFEGSGVVSKTFMSNVFSYMFAALGITGIVAYAFGNSYELMSYLIYPEGGATPLGWIVSLAPLAFVLFMSFRFEKMSTMTLLTLFIAFSVLMGMSFSFIFLVYTTTSIAATFGVTGITFGIMAVVGYTTKTDLTKFGAILYMALIGMIIAMVINWFLGSPMMSYVISLIGVLVFTGLTAYDVQKLKQIGSMNMGRDSANKMALMGALSLYLDFINLFLFLLRLMGDRR